MSGMLMNLGCADTWAGDGVTEQCGDDLDVEDVAILAEVHRGELRRFDVFVDRYKTRLVRYLHQRVGDVDAAEDLRRKFL